MPVASELSSRMLSARLICDVLMIVCVPETVRLPSITTLPEKSPSTPSNDAVPAARPVVIAEST